MKELVTLMVMALVPCPETKDKPAGTVQLKMAPGMAETL